MEKELKDQQKFYIRVITQTENLKLLPISLDILIGSAQIRGEAKGKLPDAIHLATAKTEKCDYFITNDRKIKAPKDINILVLSDFC